MVDYFIYLGTIIVSTTARMKKFCLYILLPRGAWEVIGEFDLLVVYICRESKRLAGMKSC